MKTFLKTIPGLVVILICAVILGVQNAKTVGASGQTLSPWLSYATSSGYIVGTTSFLLDATNTARVYTQISNLSSVTIYCSAKNGAPAIGYQGITIFASSTYYIKADENPYRGAIFCISPQGNASTTIIEN